MRGIDFLHGKPLRVLRSGENYDKINQLETMWAYLRIRPI